MTVDEKRQKIIAARIKHIRTAHKMSQKELGKRIGCGSTTISNYEICYSEPSVEALMKMADVFNIDASYFLPSRAENSFEMPRLSQNGVVTQAMPYYKITNTNGLLLKDDNLADGYIVFPRKTTYTNDIICTDIPDSSMAAAGFRQGEFLFVDTVALPLNGEYVLIYEAENSKMLLRKYLADGPMITLLAEDFEKAVPAIYTDKNQSDYQLVGTVVRWTSSKYCNNL